MASAEASIVRVTQRILKKPMRRGASPWTSRFAVLAMACVLLGCAHMPPAPSIAHAGAGSAVPTPHGEDAGRGPATDVSAKPTPSLTVDIATGNPRETDYRIGRDLATMVAPDAGFALDVVATKGSADNLHRLTDDPNVDLAIVQYDVVQAYFDEAARGNAAATRIVRPLRVVTPLYTQEMYFVVRRDSTMRTLDDIKGSRINLGAAGSGSALTVASLYRRLFGAPIPVRDARYFPDDEALAALTVDKSVDVVAVVAGQPATIFADMKPQAARYIRLLPFDPHASGSREALQTYFPATIRARDYHTWLDADVPTLSVMSFLVTTDRRDNAMYARLGAFAHSLCANFARLQVDGHPKWREVALGEQFGQHWTYAAASASAFRHCPSASP